MTASAAQPAPPDPAPPFTWLEFTGSTQEVVSDGIAADPSAWSHGAAVATADQRSGRGRRGRSWGAPAGSSLAVSVLLRPAADPVHWSWITLAVAVALAERLRELEVPAIVKWPNDVLVEDGRKVSGILAQVLPDRSGLIVGIGLNLDFGEAGAPVPTAADLTAWWPAVRTADRAEQAKNLQHGVVRAVNELDHALAGETEPVTGDHPAVRHIVEKLATIGRQVRAEQPDGTQLIGRAVGLGAGGTLLLEVPDTAHAQQRRGMIEKAGDQHHSHPAPVRKVEISAADVVHVRLHGAQ